MQVTGSELDKAFTGDSIMKSSTTYPAVFYALAGEQFTPPELVESGVDEIARYLGVESSMSSVGTSAGWLR